MCLTGETFSSIEMRMGEVVCRSKICGAPAAQTQLLAMIQRYKPVIDGDVRPEIARYTPTTAVDPSGRPCSGAIGETEDAPVPPGLIGLAGAVFMAIDIVNTGFYPMMRQSGPGRARSRTGRGP